MATVYLAQDLRRDRQVAIKLLRPELAAVLGAERIAVMADGHFVMTRLRAPADTGTVRPRLILIEHWLSEIGPLLKR
jgi:hypothetical protein